MAAIRVGYCNWDEVLNAIVVDVGADITGECIQWGYEAILYEVFVTFGNRL